MVILTDMLDGASQMRTDGGKRLHRLIVPFDQPNRTDRTFGISGPSVDSLIKDHRFARHARLEVIQLCQTMPPIGTKRSRTEGADASAERRIGAVVDATPSRNRTLAPFGRY